MITSGNLVALDNAQLTFKRPGLENRAGLTVTVNVSRNGVEFYAQQMTASSYGMLGSDMELIAAVVRHIRNPGMFSGNPEE